MALLCTTRTELSTRTQTRNLTKLRISAIKKLVKPEVQNPTRGLEGMIRADEILLSRGAVGFLIGGVAQECYRSDNPAAYKKHKDVDVMVMDENFELRKDFEGGIDWFLPRDEGWINANGIILNYFIREEISGAGLYVPNFCALAEIAVIDAMSYLDQQDLSPEEYVGIIREVQDDLLSGNDYFLLSKDNAPCEEFYEHLTIVDRKVPKIDAPLVPKWSNRYYQALQRAIWQGPPALQYAIRQMELYFSEDSSPEIET
ncbi:MAG: hypothetical protein CMH61_03065 [Nanoarchaeota archaeon]|nr:hypothetical protein [Nanoarchaeota archaeon]|tara:strand:+ start:1216 stop:1989 length:774 start_codon:yes stop_codon:yes gene_type:complete